MVWRSRPRLKRLIIRQRGRARTGHRRLCGGTDRGVRRRDDRDDGRWNAHGHMPNANVFDSEHGRDSLLDEGLSDGFRIQVGRCCFHEDLNALRDQGERREEDQHSEEEGADRIREKVSIPNGGISFDMREIFHQNEDGRNENPHGRQEITNDMDDGSSNVHVLMRVTRGVRVGVRVGFSMRMSMRLMSVIMRVAVIVSMVKHESETITSHHHTT